MGFGMEILFVLMLGLLIMGPKQLHTVLRHMARAKAELEHATRGFKSQLAAEFDAGANKTDRSYESDGEPEVCPTRELSPDHGEPIERAGIRS